MCAAGVQLMRHAPRYETSVNPSIHVEQLAEKVTVRGSVLQVGKPVCGFKVSYLSFRVQVRL